MPPRRPQASRREILLAFGVLSGGLAVVCGGGMVAGLLWLAARRREAPPTPTAISPTATTTPPYYPRSAWGALPPDHNAPNENGFYSADNPEGWRIYEAPLTDVYRTVVIHHSVIDEGDDIRTLQAIQRLHRVDRGWADVGYHYFVGKDGNIYEGRDIHVRGTHVAGYNTGSVGVCLLGNFTTASPSAAQINSAHIIIGWLADQLQLTHLAGHNDFNPQTECPGAMILPYLDLLAQEAGLARGTAGYQPPNDSAMGGGCPCKGHL